MLMLSGPRIIVLRRVVGLCQGLGCGLGGLGVARQGFGVHSA